MCAFFIVGQKRPDPLRHDHDERPIIHVQPNSRAEPAYCWRRERTGYWGHYQDRARKNGASGADHVEDVYRGASELSRNTGKVYVSAKSLACANKDATDFSTHRLFMSVNS